MSAENPPASATPPSRGPSGAAPAPADAAASETPLAIGFKRITGDAFGLGIALVVLPSLALFFGVERFAATATISLPLTAIFGIMILFGALALVGTLYSRLNLADAGQALGLPAGSMRAFMALSLIVLFAIISIMVYRSMMEPFRVTGLTLAEREAMVLKIGDRMIGIVEEACFARPATAASGAAGAAPTPAACADTDRRFTLVLRPPPDPASTDLAKQLLILVGTLMTSVTSFYFSARGSSQSSDGGAPTPAPAPPGGPAAGPAAGPMAGPTAGPTAGPMPTPAPRPEPLAALSDAEAHADGCNVAITEATPDEDLPPARGGVAP